MGRGLDRDLGEALIVQSFPDFGLIPRGLVLEVEAHLARGDHGLNAALLYPRQSRECGTHPVRSAGGSVHPRHQQRHVVWSRRRRGSRRALAQDPLEQATHLDLLLGYGSRRRNELRGEFLVVAGD